MPAFAHQADQRRVGHMHAGREPGDRAGVQLTAEQIEGAGVSADSHSSLHGNVFLYDDIAEIDDIAEADIADIAEVEEPRSSPDSPDSPDARDARDARDALHTRRRVPYRSVHAFHS